MATVQTDIPVFTGNELIMEMDGQVIGLVQSVTVSRTVNRTPQYQVGTPLFADAPVTQALVSISINNLVPLQGVSNAGTALSQLGITPDTSLVDEVFAGSHSLVFLNEVNGTPAYSVSGAYYNNDAVTVPSTAVLTLSLSMIARDSSTWT